MAQHFEDCRIALHAEFLRSGVEKLVAVGPVVRIVGNPPLFAVLFLDCIEPFFLNQQSLRLAPRMDAESNLGIVGILRHIVHGIGEVAVEFLVVGCGIVTLESKARHPFACTLPPRWHRPVGRDENTAVDENLHQLGRAVRLER